MTPFDLFCRVVHLLAIFLIAGIGGAAFSHGDTKIVMACIFSFIMLEISFCAGKGKAKKEVFEIVNSTPRKEDNAGIY